MRNASDTTENAGIGTSEHWSPGTDPIPRNLLEIGIYLPPHFKLDAPMSKTLQNIQRSNFEAWHECCKEEQLQQQTLETALQRQHPPKQPKSNKDNQQNFVVHCPT